jgi:hypothetical protein
MDPVTASLASLAIGCATVTAGFVLYRVVPETYSKIRRVLGRFFYKTTVLSMSQNRVKVIKILQFVSKLKQQSDIETVRVCIDKAEYTLSLDEIEIIDPKTGYSFYMKVNIDGSGSITNIHIYTYKRFLIFATNDERITAFDGFLDQFPCDQPSEDKKNV